MPSSRRPQPEANLMLLAVSRAEAESIIARQHTQGRELLAAAEAVVDVQTYREWKAKRQRWREITERALRTIFTTDEAARDFKATTSLGASFGHENIDTDFDYGKRTATNGLNKLISFRDQLEY